jgi:hypothetical protein
VLRNIVEGALGRLGYQGPEASRDLVEKRDALAREVREMEGHVSWLERAVFFRSTPDEARLRQAKAELEAAERELAERAERDRQAIVQVGADVPPLRIAQRLGEAYGRLARCVGEASDADLVGIATVLDALAEDVRNTYLADVDIEQAIDELDRRSRHDVPRAHPAPKPEEHPQWGWAPIGQEALVALAVANLDDAGVDALRARLQAERAELEAAEAGVRAAEEARSFGARVLGDSPELAEQKQALKKEEWDVFLATETHRLALLGALQAYPPMRVYLAACATATILSGTVLQESQIVWPGVIAFRNTGHLGFVATALTELVHATEAAFPGACVFARITVVVPRATGQRALTPYRASPAAEATAPPAQASAAAAQLFDALDRLGVSEWLARGVAHAAAGSTLRAKGEEERPTLASRLAFWSGAQTAKQAEDLELRGRWHAWAASTFAGRLWWAPSEAGAGQFEIALRDGLVNVHHKLNHVNAACYEGVQHVFVPRFIAPVVEAIDRLGSVIGSGMNIGGTRYALADAARDYIERYPPSHPPYRPGDPPRLLTWPDVVATIGEALRAYGFGPAYAQLQAASAELEAVVPLGEQAERDVPFLDWLDFFTDSEAEQNRDRLLGRADELRMFLVRQRQALETMLDQGLLAYPPASLYYSLEVLRKHVLAIRLEVWNTRGGRHYQHIGLDTARWVLAGWTRSAYGLFGIAPSNGVLLARYALRTLAG